MSLLLLLLLLMMMMTITGGLPVQVVVASLVVVVVVAGRCYRDLQTDCRHLSGGQLLHELVVDQVADAGLQPGDHLCRLERCG